MMKQEKIGFGGGCHWCTEAIFQALVGVCGVAQGWISSKNHETFFSEGVIVDFEPKTIPLEILITIHLNTHGSTSKHQMRQKYRSAIYTFSNKQKVEVPHILNTLRKSFSAPFITEVVPFGAFKTNPPYENYYYSNPEKPFCKTFVDPKLRLLIKDYSKYVNHEKITLK